MWLERTLPAHSCCLELAVCPSIQSDWQRLAVFGAVVRPGHGHCFMSFASHVG